LRRGGLTLIEVVAAIAILGAILVGIVLAKARHTHQLALARQTHVAVRAADGLIARWWAEPDGVPIGESGVLGADESLTWQTRLVENETVERLGTRVARVEVYESKMGTTQAADPGEPLVTVDLVLPVPEAKPAPEVTP
jgi:prepilin-type N-terminal cleavage/methylation domain-containing protein